MLKRYNLLPYVNRKGEELQLPNDQLALLILDNFKAQITSFFLELLDSYNLDIVLLQANCTDRLQLLELSVNKSVKDFCTHSLKTGMQNKSFPSCRKDQKLFLLI